MYLENPFILAIHTHKHKPLHHWSPAVLWPPGAGRGSGCRRQSGSPPALSCGLSSVESQHQPEGKEAAGRGDSASSPWGSGCVSAPGSSGCPYGMHSPLCNYWWFVMTEEKLTLEKMPEDGTDDSNKPVITLTKR